MKRRHFLASLRIFPKEKVLRSNGISLAQFYKGRCKKYNC